MKPVPVAGTVVAPWSSISAATKGSLCATFNAFCTPAKEAQLCNPTTSSKQRVPLQVLRAVGQGRIRAETPATISQVLNCASVCLVFGLHCLRLTGSHHHAYGYRGIGTVTNERHHTTVFETVFKTYVHRFNTGSLRRSRALLCAQHDGIKERHHHVGLCKHDGLSYDHNAGVVAR